MGCLLTLTGIGAIIWAIVQRIKAYHKAQQAPNNEDGWPDEHEYMR
jgi:hypothetical protein